MNALKSIIKNLSEEERKNFEVDLNKKNRRGDVKNIRLFKLLCAGKDPKKVEEIYNSPSRNAYHALCNRLESSLIDFIASQSFSGETSSEMEIMKLLLASRILFERKNNKIAFKTLLKAENKALEEDLYAILNEIYHTKIQYAHLSSNTNLPLTIATSQRNMIFYQKEFHLNLAYASIKAQLKNQDAIDANAIILKVFDEFQIEIEKSLNFKSLFQLMEITSTTASLKSDYYTISPLIKQIYTVVEDKKDAADKHLFYHIEILHTMAVASFRNKEFDVALKYMDRMEDKMRIKNQMYFKLFNEKLILIKSLILNYTGDAKNAIMLLVDQVKISDELMLAQCTFLFQQDRYAEAYQKFKHFTHSDSWYEKKRGWQFLLKKSILEILLLIELEKLDLVFYRLQAFKRKFNKFLKENGEDRVITFMGFVNAYSENPKVVITEAFKIKVEKSFNWIGPEREDIFVMSFYAWLKAKMEKKKLYQTTLTLVQSS